MAEVMCVGAHPDDVEIGMGATVAGLARRGVDVVIVDITDGEPTPHGSVEIRRAEAAAAAEVLGVRRIVLGQPNRYLFDTVEARTELAEVIRDERPRQLFVPYPVDAHPDHVAAASIAEAARFYAKFTRTEMRGAPHYPTRVIRYMAVHMRLVVPPACVVDVSDDLATKLTALRCYRSQFEANPANAALIDEMGNVAARWGSMIGTAAGEPLFSAEPLGIARPEDLV